MCANNGTRLFNLLVVALLIQRVALVVHAAAASAAHVSVSLTQRRANVADTGDKHDTTSSHRRFVRHTKEQHISDGVDFAAYVNDFNIADEASIPEDILDQQHIEYGDIIDAESLQYGETEAAADIILAAQRSSSKNITAYPDVKAKKSNNADDNSSTSNSRSSSHGNNSNNGPEKWHNKSNKNHYNKFKNNKDNEQDNNYDDDDDIDVDVDDYYVEHDESLAAGIDGPKAVSSSRGAANDKKFKSMQEIQQNPKQPVRRADSQQLELASSLSKLNKRKFNKVAPVKSSGSGSSSGADGSAGADVKADDYKNNKDDNNINSKDAIGSHDDEDDANNGNGRLDADEIAIGDIEDNFGNEDGAAVVVAQLEEQEKHENAPSRVDRDEAAVASGFVSRKSKRHDGAQKASWRNRFQEDKATTDAIAANHEADKVQNNYSKTHLLISSNSSGAPHNSRQSATEVAEMEAEKANDARLKPAQHAPTTMAGEGAAETAQSAFERHKAQRRYNRRYGHRSHKKKYKDYLRYAVAGTTAGEKGSGGASAANGMSAVNATLTKLTNNTKHNYQQLPELELEPEDEATKLKRAEKLRKYARKIEAERKAQKGLPASPIFVVANRNVAEDKAEPRTAKPFYEGQINYYIETKDDDNEGEAAKQRSSPNMESMIAADNGNWYRRVSPVLRNGVKASNGESKQGTAEAEYRQHHHHHRNRQQQQHHHGHHRNHHKHHHSYGKYPYQQQQQQPQHQIPYQRKLLPGMLPSPAASGTQHATQTPLPPPSYKQHAGAMQELGHQITEMEEFERYYAKWPHLARVQFQVYDEHYRETHPELYPDYDYESAAELEEAQNPNDEEANLPPYIKKYNRRNKQLLNLLEGTLPPPPERASPLRPWSSSLLQPGPHDSSRSSSASVVRIDDDYLKEKRKRYHNRYANSNSNNNNKLYHHDLFAQQRAEHQQELERQEHSDSGSSTTASAEVSATTGEKLANQLPDENLSVSLEEDVGGADIWQKEIENKSHANDEMTGSAQMTWQIEKLTTPPAPPAALATAATPKPAVFKLPSYPAIAGTFMGAKPRSRSAQFAPSSGSSIRGNGYSGAAAFGYAHQAGGNSNNNNNNNHYYYKSLPLHYAAVTYDAGSTMSPSAFATATPAPTAAALEAGDTATSKAINTFVYHRVVDASPRLVGAGLTGRKQRLPFVAITDRRLETSKKILLERQKDFEQNHFPMP